MNKHAVTDERLKAARKELEQRVAEICRSVAAGKIGMRGAEATLRDLEHRLRNVHRAERRRASRSCQPPLQLRLDLGAGSDPRARSRGGRDA